MKNTGSLTLAVALAAGIVRGGTCVWTGGTVTRISNVDYYCASSPANWQGGVAPVDGDDIVFDSTGAGYGCRWDLDIAPRNWTQTSDYVKTVTFLTTYETGACPFFQVTNDVSLQGGTWTHLANTDLNRTYRLYVKVGGDMTVGAAAKVTAEGLGYKQQYMAKGGTFSGTKIYATHGGFGYENTVRWPLGGNGAVPYGKVQAPEEPGSGGSTQGGGAIRLDVTGKLTVDGVINANALYAAYYTGAGGSVYLRAGTIAGSGSVTANSVAGLACGNGSGGRIAIILTEAGATFDDFDPQVRCAAYSSGGTSVGQAGTIYAETPQDTPDEGWLIIRGSGTASSNGYCNMTPVIGYGMGTAKYSRITATGTGASICIPDYATVDMSSMAPGTFPGTVKLAGGTWKPPLAGTIDYSVISYGGLGGVDSAELRIVSGGALTVSSLAESQYDGDFVVGGDVTVTLNSTLKIAGDMFVTGTVSRTDTASPTKAIAVEVDGDLTVGEAGQISARGLGYAGKTCPTEQVYAGASASHAGWGWATTSANSGPSGTQPYGSVKEPLTSGAGGNKERGGGILRLVVGGTLTNDGLLSAEAVEAGYYVGAGGSVNIRAAELLGSGVISAAAWQSFVSGTWAQSSGGRVAIRLTGQGADFSGYTGSILANGTHKRSPAVNEYTGSAGTVWLKSAAEGEADGRLIVDNGFAGLTWYRATLLGGDYMAADELSYRDVLVGRSCRLQLAEDKTLTVSGVFSNGCEFASTAGSTVIFDGSGTGTVYGNTTFCHLGCQTPGKEIRFAAGSTTTVTGSVDFTGTEGEKIVLKSTVDGETWTLDAAAVTMNGVALKDCTATQPITILNGQDLGGNSANVTFQSTEVGELLTWTGAEGTSWAAGGNWDKGRAPITTDLIAIPAGCPNMPVLATDTTVAELAVSNGASLALGGRMLTVNGDLLVAGALVASGEEIVSVASNATLAAFTPAQSTVRLTGTDPRTLSVGAGAQFWNLDFGIGRVTVHGDVTADALTVGNGTDEIGLLFDDGATVETVAFTVDADPAGASGSLEAAGASGIWYLVASEPDVTGVTVTGCDASEGVTVVPKSCTDGGRNVNWLFVDNRTHWTGAVSGDFATAGNWSDGVPTAEKDAVIEGSVVCAVTAAGAVRILTVAPSAKIRIDSSDFAVAGSLTVESAGTVEWNVPGTIAGKLTILRDAVLTHAANGSTGTARIDLTVGRAGYVAAGAKIDATGKRTDGGVSGAFCSHGGRHGTRSTPPQGTFCYGSILRPTMSGNVGGGTGSYGGGAVKVVFGGTLRVDGEVAADATPSGGHYSSAGGSVWLQAESLIGSGAIRADGGKVNGIDGGAGGRIAIHLTQASELAFSGTVRAVGGRTSTDYTRGSCGTVYLETAADAPGCGTLTIANLEDRSDSDYTDSYATDFPVIHENDNPTEAKGASVIVKHYGSLYLTQDATVADIHLLDSTAKLRLNGHRLRVRTFAHPVSPDDATQIIPGEGGGIDWTTHGLMLIVR